MDRNHGTAHLPPRRSPEETPTKKRKGCPVVVRNPYARPRFSLPPPPPPKRCDDGVVLPPRAAAVADAAARGSREDDDGVVVARARTAAATTKKAEDRRAVKNPYADRPRGGGGRGDDRCPNRRPPAAAALAVGGGGGGAPNAAKAALPTPSEPLPPPPSSSTVAGCVLPPPSFGAAPLPPGSRRRRPRRSLPRPAASSADTPPDVGIASGGSGVFGDDGRGGGGNGGAKVRNTDDDDGGDDDGIDWDAAIASMNAAESTRRPSSAARGEGGGTSTSAAEDDASGGAPGRRGDADGLPLRDEGGGRNGRGGGGGGGGGGTDRGPPSSAVIVGGSSSLPLGFGHRSVGAETGLTSRPLRSAATELPKVERGVPPPPASATGKSSATPSRPGAREGEEDDLFDDGGIDWLSVDVAVARRGEDGGDGKGTTTADCGGAEWTFGCEPRSDCKRATSHKPSPSTAAAPTRPRDDALPSANHIAPKDVPSDPVGIDESDDDEYGDGGIDWSTVDVNTQPTSDRRDNDGPRQSLAPESTNPKRRRPDEGEAVSPAPARGMLREIPAWALNAERRHVSMITDGGPKFRASPARAAAAVGRAKPSTTGSTATRSTDSGNAGPAAGRSGEAPPPTVPPRGPNPRGAAPVRTEARRDAGVVADPSTGSAGGDPAGVPATPARAAKPAPLASVAMPRDERPSLPPELSYPPHRVQPIEDKRRADLVRNADLSSKLPNGWTILPHQKAGILRGLSMRRLVLAFDMGLGKTLIGCVWAKAFVRTYERLRVYIVCPVSLKQEWERTARDVAGLRTGELSSPKKKRKRTMKRKKKDSSEEEREDIDSDEKKNDDDDEEEEDAVAARDLDVEISSWAKIPKNVPTNVRNYVVICDEAHSMQSMSSARTKDALRLVRAKRCVGVLLLTGTPMKNGKPSNLFPLLRAVRHPFGDDQKSYEVQFCDGREKRYGPHRKPVWDANGSSNLRVLNAHVASHVFRMTKEDCLKNLPPKTRVYRTVPVCSRHRLKHANAMNELAKAQGAFNGTENDASAEALLGAFSKVRMAASFAKIDATVALATSVLEKESAIVIFANFVAVAKEVHAKLEGLGWSGEILTGETPPNKRQGMVDNFQAGLSAVFVCTFGAGGVGLTLTAARTVVLLDRPWTPGDAQQAEDRVRRIGQTRPVDCIWMKAFDVDERIDDLIERKRQNSSAVVDSASSADASGIGDGSRPPPKISIFQLVRSIVSDGDRADGPRPGPGAADRPTADPSDVREGRETT